MQRDTKYLSVFSTKYLSVFSPNAGKYGPEITPYLDTFHVVNHTTTTTNYVRFIVLVLVYTYSNINLWLQAVKFFWRLCIGQVVFLKIQTNRASCQDNVKRINYCERNLATFVTFSSHNNLFSGLSFNFIFSVTTTLLYIFQPLFFLQFGYFPES